MPDLLSLALLIASSLGHDGRDATAIASAIARACPDSLCVVDAAVFAEHESHWQLHPHPYSADAKSGLALGPLQVHGAGVRLDDQVARWVALRAWSLDHCGDLSALASGSCTRGVTIARTRRQQAEAWLYVMGWSEMP